MSRWSRRSIGLVSLLFCLLLPHVTFAKDAPTSLPEAKSELSKQKSKIESLKELILDTLKIHTRHEHELKDVEIKISSLEQKFKRTSQQAAQRAQEVSALEARIADLQQRQEAQRIAFDNNLRAAHRNSQESRLQLILSQKDPAAISRMLKYYEYISRSQLNSLHVYQNTLEQLKKLNEEKTHALQKLHSKKIELSSARLELNESLQDRKTLLQASREKIARERGQLKELQKDQQALANVIARLRRQQQLAQQKAQQKAQQQQQGKPTQKRNTAPPPALQPLRGDLLWPTQGQLAHRFGEQRAEGALTWNGIFINAPAGTPVVAVRGGIVVFAEWLRGFGLLLIIDHQNGYLSLYGHNANLRKHVGDSVSTGEVIAAVGQSGGNDQSGLYFEIRAQGRPVNPLTWMPRK